MLRWCSHRRFTPIGIDIGGRSIKLVQFTQDRTRLVESARVDLPPGRAQQTGDRGQGTGGEELAAALRSALENRRFRGRDAVLCVRDRDLFVQSLRVPKQAGPLDKLIAQEAAGRIPYPIAEAEIRYLEAADVRQGDQTLREVIVFAVQRAVVETFLQVVEAAGLHPVAVDVEPAALVRSYASQYRRDEDRQDRALIVHVGYSRTTVLIAQWDELLFVKHIDVGGQHFDLAVARHLKMELAEAVSLRKHHADRRAEMQDPEVARSLADGTRPAVERLASELAMCIRYHSVTFRGLPIVRLVLSGGEATPQLLDSLARQLDLRCELSDPFRSLAAIPKLSRKGQWDVAAGLALRDLN